MNKFTILLALVTALMLMLFRPAPTSIIKLIDFRTLIILATFMIVQSYWSLSGVASYVALKVARKGAHLFLIASAVIASIIMNDAAAILLTPMAVIGFDDPKLISLLAIAINVGSSITPFGNPQNVIIWTYYKVPVHEFVLNQLPWTLPLLLLTALLGRGRAKGGEASISLSSLTTSALLLLMTVSLIELKQEALALLLALVAFSTKFKRAPRIDYELLIQLTLMFISFGLIREHYKFILNGLSLLITSIALSQVISNVPATLILLGSNWRILAIGVNVGGLGSPIGSLANLIVLRISKVDLKIFMRYNLLMLIIAIITSTLIVYFNLCL